LADSNSTYALSTTKVTRLEGDQEGKLGLKML